MLCCNYELSFQKVNKPRLRVKFKEDTPFKLITRTQHTRRLTPPSERTIHHRCQTLIALQRCSVIAWG
jgi:hypothetical protein